MIYRLQVDAFFTEFPPYRVLRDIQEYVQDHAKTINPGMPNQEPSSYSFHKCLHDEDTSGPCEIINQWSSD